MSVSFVRHLRLVSVFVALALVGASCSGGGSDGSDDAANAEPTASVVPATPTVVPTPFPTVDDVPDAQPGVEGTAAERVDDFVEWFNGGAFDQEIFEASFADEFVAQVPFEAFAPTIVELSAGGPWTVDRIAVATPDAQQVVIVNEARDRAWLLSLNTDDDGRIAGAFLEPSAIEPQLPAVGFAEVVSRLDEMGTLRFLIATPRAGECNVLANQSDTEPMPLASTFKLYVLGALVQAVASGEVAWEQPVVVRDELDSVPTGITQDEPAGTELTVFELASRMISISDNTATDHLIDLVGDEALQASMAALGHHDPSLNNPMLTTREFTILKADIALGDRYVAATGRAARVAVLADVAEADLPDLAELVAVFSSGDPRPTQIEWFGSSQDLCHALAWLVGDATAREILTAAPLGQNVALWSELGFKGGSEPGTVLVTAWWMRTAGGDTYVTVASLVNENETIDETAAIDLMVSLRDSTLTLSGG